MQHSKKLKILVSAYACSPYHGSEPGLGWHVVKNLSKHHELHVITEEVKFRRDIEKKLNEEPDLKQNLHFHFIPKKRRKLLRKIWPPSYYWYYKEWQKDAYSLALELTDKHVFDVLHQFNMIGYREPGYLWKIKNLPLIWGPVGGFAQLKWSYIPILPFFDQIYYTGRNIYNKLQMLASLRAKKLAKKSDVIISASIDSFQGIKKYFDQDSILITETGANYGIVDRIDLEEKFNKRDQNYIKIVWVGKLIGLKALNIGLEALSLLPKSINYRLEVIGDGPNLNIWKHKSEDLGIGECCKFYGRLSHSETQDHIASSDILLFTSLQEGTPHVVLESLANGVPVLCHDANGHSSVVDDTCGIKIPMETPKRSINDFKDAIIRLYMNPKELEKLSYGALEKAKEHSWSNKATQIERAYFNAKNNFIGNNA